MKKLNEASVLFCSHFPQCILNSRGFCGLSICIYCIYSCGCVLLSLFTAPAELTLYIIYCVAAASPLQLLTKRFPHKTHTSQIHRRSICICNSISNSISICICIYSCCAAAVAQSSNPLKTHIICRYRQRRSQRQQVAQVAAASDVASVSPVSSDTQLS